MEDRHFDLLTRVLGSAPSRRAALGGIASTALGALAATLGLESSEAKKNGKKRRRRRRRGKCGSNEKKCHGTCIKKSQCCNDSDCSGGKVCQGKSCTCPSGTKDCAGSCIPSGNCCTSGDCGECEGCQGGTCVSGCLPGQICQGGTCACPSGQKECQGGCIPSGNCCTDVDCPTSQVCKSGTCGCPTGQKLCGNQCIPNADVCFLRVTPSNLRGWLLFGEDPFSNDSSLTQILTGPGDPPAPGDGSVKLDPTAFSGFAEDQTQAVLRTLQYQGTMLGNINQLAYSIFVPASAGDSPTMQLAVVGDFNSESFASLVFIPGLNGNAAPNSDDWTDYTPSQAGNWISTRDIIDSGGTCLMCRSIGSAHEGQCTDTTTCNANKLKTWAQIPGLHPERGAERLRQLQLPHRPR